MHSYKLSIDISMHARFCLQLNQLGQLTHTHTHTLTVIWIRRSDTSFAATTPRRFYLFLVFINLRCITKIKKKKKPNPNINLVFINISFLYQKKKKKNFY